MKAIILICSDGSRHLAFVVAENFDTQAWANSRRESFALLKIIRITEETKQ